jgi:RNA polymerase sigma-70 factor (ECF subfamily)
MPDSSLESNATQVLSASDAARVNARSAVEQELIELFDQWRDRLFRYLLGFSLTVADSEDIIQETFLALFLHLQSGKSRHNLRGWLFRVAHNLALKQQRSRRGSESISEPISESIHPALNPEELFRTNQTQQRLMAVMLTLPEQSRCCLYLRAEGLRYREIAEVLDMSLGSVANCLERSLARIARAAER